jgi:Fe-Mn family superoxide dismutase
MSKPTLPELSYPLDALEPFVDARTMGIHHGKHHAAYVNNLIVALDKHPALYEKSVHELVANLEALPDDIRNAVRNNGGGHLNHTLFWDIMAPGAGGDPTGPVAEAITGTFGDYGTLKEKLKAAALGQFGSGWAWLSVAADGKLIVEATANQDSPISKGNSPVIGIDVWEHAYYLQYQNLRANYVDAWFNTVNWSKVNALFLAAQR